MSSIQITALLALSALTFATSSALAQRFFRPDPGPSSSNVGAATERDVAICGTSGGGTRIRESNCEVETTRLRTEVELKLAIAIPEVLSTQCAASTTIEYQQLDTAAHVDGKLEIADCKAASGTFKVAVRAEDASGADKLLEFDETWQRKDDEDVAFTGDYPIGEDAELVSVRVRGLTCTCTDAPKNE